MMIVLRTDEGVDLLTAHVLVDPDVKLQSVLAHVTYEENGEHFAFAMKLMPWADLEEIAAWVRSCGDEFVGIADGILEGRRVQKPKPKPDGSNEADEAER